MKEKEFYNKIIKHYEEAALNHNNNAKVFEASGNYSLAALEHEKENFFYGLIAKCNAIYQQELFSSNITNAGNYINISERLPSKEEYLKNDGRFIGTDGNRKYPVMFDYYDDKFKHYCSMEEDLCIKAWCELP